MPFPTVNILFNRKKKKGAEKNNAQYLPILRINHSSFNIKLPCCFISRQTPLNLLNLPLSLLPFIILPFQPPLNVIILFTGL